jgi:hypothetical protein
MIYHRADKYQAWVDTINKTENGFDAFSRGYETYGFQVLKNGDISYREWAPNAETAALIGDFSELQLLPAVGWGNGSLILLAFCRRMGPLSAPYEKESFRRVRDHRPSRQGRPRDSSQQQGQGECLGPPALCCKLTLFSADLHDAPWYWRAYRACPCLDQVGFARLLQAPKLTCFDFAGESRRTSTSRPFTMPFSGTRLRSISSRTSAQRLPEPSRSTRLTVSWLLRTTFAFA